MKTVFALLVVRATALFGMFGRSNALNALKARRSVVKYSDKAVPASATTKALEAAVQAPNHFLSEPWRFYTAGPQQCTNHIAPPTMVTQVRRRRPSSVASTKRSARPRRACPSG